MIAYQPPEVVIAFTPSPALPAALMAALASLGVTIVSNLPALSRLPSRPVVTPTLNLDTTTVSPME